LLNDEEDDANDEKVRSYDEKDDAILTLLNDEKDDVW